MTCADYRNPGRLPDGGVLVVGASASGVQIAEELALSGRPVTLAVGEHVRMPRTYRGRDILWWMDASGLLDERWDAVPDLVRVRALPSMQLVGAPRTLDLTALRGLGVTLVGRLAGVRDGSAQFAGSLANVTALADLKLGRLLDTLDAWADGRASTRSYRSGSSRPRCRTRLRCRCGSVPAVNRSRTDPRFRFTACIRTGYSSGAAGRDPRMLDLVTSGLDWLGLLAFATTGALVASRKEMDLFGFALLGTVTGIGGGTLRDLLLGTAPVFWVREPAPLLACVGVSAVVYFTAHIPQSRYRLLLWLDAVGLALFAVAGAEKALVVGAAPAVAVAMGVVTATFGGIIRDVLGGESPVVLSRRDLRHRGARRGGPLCRRAGARARARGCPLTGFAGRC